MVEIKIAKEEKIVPIAKEYSIDKTIKLEILNTTSSAENISQIKIKSEHKLREK